MTKVIGFFVIKKIKKVLVSYQEDFLSLLTVHGTLTLSVYSPRSRKK